jgi:hypothetical protein
MMYLRSRPSECKHVSVQITYNTQRQSHWILTTAMTIVCALRRGVKPYRPYVTLTKSICVHFQQTAVKEGSHIMSPYKFPAFFKV